MNPDENKAAEGLETPPAKADGVETLPAVEPKPEVKLEEKPAEEPKKEVDPTAVDPKELYLFLHERSMWEEGERKRVNQAKELREQGRRDKEEGAKIKAEAQKLYSKIDEAKRLTILREHLKTNEGLSDDETDSYLRSKGLLKEVKPEDILALVPSLVEEEVNKRESVRKLESDKQKITAVVNTLAIKNGIRPNVALALVKGVLTSGVRDTETGEWIEPPLAATPEDAMTLLMAHGFKGGEPLKSTDKDKPPPEATPDDLNKRKEWARNSFGS